MPLSTRGLAWSMGLLWGGVMLVVGAANLVFSSYGVGFLEWAASFYPGYGGPAGFGSVVVVTLYGLVDGAIGGWVLAWLYNRCTPGEAAAELP